MFPDGASAVLALPSAEMKSRLIPRRSKSAIPLACGFSLVFHVGLIALVTIWPRHARSTPLEGSSLVLVDTIEAPGATFPTPPDIESARPIREATRAPRGEPRRRPPRRVAIVVRPAHVESAPQAPPAPTAEVIQPDSPPARPQPRRWLDGDAARNLRIHDPLPRLPGPLRASRFDGAVLFEICVSEKGTIESVTVPDASGGSLVSALRTAIWSWRYRPLLINGSPAPFCHSTRIRYEYSRG
jgi:Gram-negative bacterial TonB protein C-terminal